MSLFGRQFSERLGVHGFATLSTRRACPASLRHMENQVVQGPVEGSVAVVVDEQESEIIEELLVEEISIDGMCGVY